MEQLRQWPPLSMQGTDTEPPQDLHKQAPEETGGGGGKTWKTQRSPLRRIDRGTLWPLIVS